MFPFHFGASFPKRGPQRTDFSSPAELCRPGRGGQLVLGFPPASIQPHARTAGMRLPRSPLPGQGRFPAKTSAHPLIRFRLQMKYNCRAEMGKTGFFMRHSVHCVNGLLINHGLPQNPQQSPKSCHITELSVLFLSAYKRKQGHQFSLGEMPLRL